MADNIQLAAPTVIDEQSLDQIFDSLKDRLIELAPEVEPTLALDSSILVKFLRTQAYRTGLSITQVNDAVRSRLVLLAEGRFLDALGAEVGVARLDGETDAAYRERIILENRGRSTGGSQFYYEAAARRASVRVKSATVYRDRLLPIITVAILATDNGGIPDAALTDAVVDELNKNTVRLVNDTIRVIAAVSRTINIEADVWLLPNAVSSTIDQMPDILRAAWAAEAGVGFDMEPSWIKARLHLAGVKRIDIITPTEGEIAGDGEALAIGTVKINYKGSDY